MAIPLGSVTSAPVGAAAPRPEFVPAAPGAFGDSLTRMIDSVESSATGANAAVQQMLTGTGDVHDAMIALQRAELTLQLTVQVRNKLVQAYQEIMRMPV